jgi:hypothetical protein
MKKEYIFQAVLTFISVFLAILAGNWNEDFKEYRQTQVFLQNLVAELKENKNRVEKSIPYHQKLGSVSDSLFLLANDNKIATNFMAFGGTQKIPNWRGMGFAGIDNSIYQSGLISGRLNNIPFDLLSKIAKIQAIQHEYTKFNQQLFEKMVAFNSETKTVEMLMITSVLGGEIYQIERELNVVLGQLIVEIEKEVN